jgi:hypothetical protein
LFLEHYRFESIPYYTVRDGETHLRGVEGLLSKTVADHLSDRDKPIPITD